MVELGQVIGHVQLVTVRCPFGHTHTVGLAATTAELWCSYSAQLYAVHLPDTEEQP